MRVLLVWERTLLWHQQWTLHGASNLSCGTRLGADTGAVDLVSCPACAGEVSSVPCYLCQFGSAALLDPSCTVCSGSGVTVHTCSTCHGWGEVLSTLHVTLHAPSGETRTLRLGVAEALPLVREELGARTLLLADALVPAAVSLSGATFARVGGELLDLSAPGTPWHSLPLPGGRIEEAVQAALASAAASWRDGRVVLSLLGPLPVLTPSEVAARLSPLGLEVSLELDRGSWVASVHYPGLRGGHVWSRTLPGASTLLSLDLERLVSRAAVGDSWSPEQFLTLPPHPVRSLPRDPSLLEGLSPSEVFCSEGLVFAAAWVRLPSGEVGFSHGAEAFSCHHVLPPEEELSSGADPLSWPVRDRWQAGDALSPPTVDLTVLDLSSWESVTVSLSPAPTVSGLAWMQDHVVSRDERGGAAELPPEECGLGLMHSLGLDPSLDVVELDVGRHHTALLPTVPVWSEHLEVDRQAFEEAWRARFAELLSASSGGRVLLPVRPTRLGTDPLPRMMRSAAALGLALDVDVSLLAGASFGVSLVHPSTLPSQVGFPMLSAAFAAGEAGLADVSLRLHPPLLAPGLPAPYVDGSWEVGDAETLEAVEETLGVLLHRVVDFVEASGILLRLDPNRLFFAPRALLRYHECSWQAGLVVAGGVQHAASLPGSPDLFDARPVPAFEVLASAASLEALWKLLRHE